jgi:Zn-dependent peptidase ImmA (M78 family)
VIELDKDYYGKIPSRYAQEILKECQIFEPPIPIDTILEFLNLSFSEFSVEGFLRFRPGDHDHEIIQHVPAFIKKNGDGMATIFVNRDLKKERQRLSIFHECGHAALPWHQHLDFFCSEEDLSHAAQKQAEQEAFAFGTELLMPSKMFVKDICSLETGLEAIELIGKRYISSFEATAIRYARYHEGICAMLMVEQEKNFEEDITKKSNPSGQLFQESPEDSGEGVSDKNSASLIVKYSSRSSRFPFSIKPRKRIDENNLIYESWNKGIKLNGEIPASIFNSKAKGNYQMETVSLGKSGKVLVLLWSPDNQVKLF